MAQRLNDHLIKDLTICLAGKGAGITMLTIDAILAEYFENDLVIMWSVEDIQHVAEEHDITYLYVEDYRRILLLAEQKMDAGLGINWDMLWIYMQEYIEGQRPDEQHPQDQTESTSAIPQPEG